MIKHSTFVSILATSLLVCLSLMLPAQDKNRDMGTQAYQSKQYMVAIDYFNKALNNFNGQKSERDDLIYILADCYRLINDQKKASMKYQQLIKTKYADKKPEVYFYYATALSTLGKYTEALSMYQKYLTKKPNDLLALAGKATCELSLRDTTTRSRWKVKIVKELNSPDDDFAAAYFDTNYSGVIFTSSRKGSTGNEKDNWTNGSFSDFYVANKQQNGSFSAPKLADTQLILNTPANEGATCYDNQYQQLYFTRCEKMSKAREHCRIMVTTKTGNSWAKPTVVYSDTLGNAGQPTLSSDGLTMFFSSNRRDGLGAHDLWKATRKADQDVFGQATNLGKLINTPGDEMFPSLFADTVLYFASNGRAGFGGLDIYCVTLGKHGISSVKHLPRPLNSQADDFAMSFEGNTEKGFFTSRRIGGRGGDDIYSFEKTKLKLIITGIVKDEITKLPLSKAPITLVSDKNDTIKSTTNDYGIYQFTNGQVKEESSYTLTAGYDDYFSKTVLLKIGKQNKDSVGYVNIELQPIPQKPIVLPDIYYELDRWEILPQYQDSLMVLVKVLNDNPKIDIELASHTDSRGSDQYNIELSQKRAESVVAFLTKKGIKNERLTAKGYGENVPRVLTKTIVKDGHSFPAGTQLTESYILGIEDVKRQEAAYQLNRRSEVSILQKKQK